MNIANNPIFTQYFNVGEFTPKSSSSYIYGQSVEERSTYTNSIVGKSKSVNFINITNIEPLSFHSEVSGSIKKYFLRSKQSLNDFWNINQPQNVYLDITGLPHHIWAPLILTGLEYKKVMNILYIEPLEYAFHTNPTEGQIFDLSEKINGVSPIPRFGRLGEKPDDDTIFVPLLGFEGIRLSHLIEHVQPQTNKTYPIVGVPGFQPEYPFHSYIGNKLPILDYQMWKEVRYAPANCPFSVFYLLNSFLSSDNDFLKIGLIGTKPHALGAILFSIKFPQKVELLYDHPIRKPKRTSGMCRILLYSISKLDII